MQLTTLDQITQFVAWFLAILNLIVGLYILVLNTRHTANRNVFVFLLFLAANTYAIGLMIGARNVNQAVFPSILLTITSPAIEAALLMASIALLKPNFYQNRWRWLYLLSLITALLPGIATLLDLFIKQLLLRFNFLQIDAMQIPFWYSGLDLQTYNGGYTNLEFFTSGILRPIISTIEFSIIPLLVIIFLLYESFFNSKALRNTKILARTLLVVNLLAAFASIYGAQQSEEISALALVITSGLFLIAYSYAGFQQMVSERRMQVGSLQTRLTAIMLVITVPLLTAMALILTSRARIQFEEDAQSLIASANHHLAGASSLWMDANLKALENLITLPEILSMDPIQQKPALEAMARAYPYMYLISTTDMNGMNIARSDAEEPKDYSDRDWFKQARDGMQVVYQTLIGRTSGQPAMVVSMPIHAANGTIIGVGMFASDLDELSDHVLHLEMGDGAIAFLVDADNKLIAHPDPTLTAELIDMSTYPPVVTLRAGKLGASEFEDENGQRWYAYADLLDNGWGAVVQQPEEKLTAPIKSFQRISGFVIAGGALLTFALLAVAIRQSILPIYELTKTATAVAGGDLTQFVPVESDDELGTLAKTFNSMIVQLRELISSLENRVAERTRALERRAAQLQVTAEVAREAAGIRDLETLLNQVVNLISERFNFYHTGIFLLTETSTDDDFGEGERTASPPRGFAVLRAASSDGGKRMLTRGHRLRVGAQGIVGYVAGSGTPRIALNVGEDAVFFNNPDLPLTRSEMALPLKSRGRVIGVLDVQSPQSQAFTGEDIAVLQILADQIGLAIENARLLTDSQRAFNELESLYGKQVREAWKKHLADKDSPQGDNETFASSIIYALDHHGVRAINPEDLSNSFKTIISSEFEGSSKKSSQTSFQIETDSQIFRAPIELRGQKIGHIILRRSMEQGSWMPQDRELIDRALTQISLALENSRLLEEIQRRALREQQINIISTQVRGLVNVDAILQTTVQELGKALGANRTIIQLGLPKQAANDGNEQPQRSSEDKPQNENNGHRPTGVG